MKCPHCGQEHPDNFQFCPVTGQELSPQFKACINEQCPDYGKYILPMDSRFCPSCGKPLDNQVGEKVVNVLPIPHVDNVDCFVIEGAVVKPERKKIEVNDLVNFICDEFLKEKHVDWRKDSSMLKTVTDIAKKYIDNDSIFNGDIYIPYVAKYDSTGRPVHQTNFVVKQGRLKYIFREEVFENYDEDWEYMNFFSNGAILKRNKGKYALVESDGHVLLPCNNSEIMELKSGYIRYRKDGKCGLLDEDNAPFLSCIYDDIMDGDDGLFKVKKQGKRYQIDKQRRIILQRTNREWSYPILKKSIVINGVVLGNTRIEDINEYIYEQNDTEIGSFKVSGLYDDNDISCAQFYKDGFVSIIMVPNSYKNNIYLQNTLNLLGASGSDKLYKCEKLSLEIRIVKNATILVCTKSDSAKTFINNFVFKIVK